MPAPDAHGFTLTLTSNRLPRAPKGDRVQVPNRTPNRPTLLAFWVLNDKFLILVLTNWKSTDLVRLKLNHKSAFQSISFQSQSLAASAIEVWFFRLLTGKCYVVESNELLVPIRLSIGESPSFLQEAFPINFIE